MPLTITNTSKNALAITNNSKDTGLTWELATFTWADATGTWEVPGLSIINTSKNSLTITNTAKT